jgi:hypothetical protein
MLSGNQAVRGLPEQRSNQQQDHQGNRQSHAAGTALVLFSLLQHAMGAKHHAPGSIRHRALPVGVLSRKGGKKLGTPIRSRLAGLPRAISAGSPLLSFLML